MQLNREQIEQVQDYLESTASSRYSVKDELLDHICCAVERRMLKGVTFSAALAESCSEMNENEVKAIIHSLTKKRRIMFQLIGGACFSLLLAFFLMPRTDDFTTYSEEYPNCDLTLLLTDDPPTENPLGSQFRMSSGFGERIHPISKTPRHHDGVDWVAPMGTPVYAAGAGRVEAAGERGDYGNYIRIAHDNEYATAYAQLSEILVEIGEEVTAGQLIGRVGNSGACTGPHLHYEVIRGGMAVDPIAYLP